MIYRVAMYCSYNISTYDISVKDIFKIFTVYEKVEFLGRIKQKKKAEPVMIKADPAFCFYI